MIPNASIQLATELRDTLLQDLVAVSLMIRIAHDQPADGLDARTLLEGADAVLRSDLQQLRAVIDRLGPPA